MRTVTASEVQVTSSAVMSAFNDAYRAVRDSVAGEVDEGLTLSAWRQRAQVTRDALMTLRQQNETEVRAICEEYSQKAAAPKVAEKREEYAAYRDLAQQRVSDDLNKVMNAKRQALQKAMAAPSEEQLRTLNALQMRSTVSREELALIASQMTGSIVAIGVVGDIAKKHSIDFPVVSVATEQAKLAKAEAYAQSMIEEMHITDKDLGYRSRIFWKTSANDYSTSPLVEADRGVLVALKEALPEVAPVIEKKQEPAPKHKSFDERFQDMLEREYPHLANIRTLNNGILHGDDNSTRVVMREGQTITDIMAAFSVTRSEIGDANPDLDLDNIRAGQKVEVPSCTLWDTKKPTAITPDQCTTFEVPLTE